MFPPTVKQRVICLPMTRRSRLKYLLASCSVSLASTLPLQVVSQLDDTLIFIAWQGGDLEVHRPVREEEWFACQTIPTMQLTGKDCKILKPCATRFSISTTLYTAFSSATETAVWQCEGKRSYSIISSVVGYLSSCPVRNPSSCEYRLLRADITSCGFSTEGGAWTYLGTENSLWNLHHPGYWF